MERVRVSMGAWQDLMAMLHLSVETHRGDGARWFGAAPPQYMITYHNDDAVEARLMGTAILLVPAKKGSAK